VSAVPAAGVELEYSQPSGEKFKAVVRGDEKFNWITAETGEVIVLDDDKYWKFAQKINGKLEPGNVKYSKTGQKPSITIKDMILSCK
jgi:outer membrane lipoprotein-sorting protein